VETDSKNSLGRRKNMKNIFKPPGWAVRFFNTFCNEHLAEAVLGDMFDLYQRRRQRLGKRVADVLFVFNVIQFIQPFAIRKRSASTHINNTAMLQNYFKIAWRSMGRQRMYSSIKIGGFAIGIATCLVIGLFIRHELSYDSHIRDAANVYRVYNDFTGPDAGKGTAFPAPFASILKTDYADVDKAARLIPYKWFNAGSNLMRREDKLENIFEERFAYADPDLLNILEIRIIRGSQKDALSKPNTIVISRSKAEKYFGTDDPIGKTIILNDDKNQWLTISGVMENFPKTSHLQFDFLITLAGKEFWQGEQTSWCCWNYNTYVKLKPGTDATTFEKKMESVKKGYVEILRKEGNTSASDTDKYLFFRMQPIRDIHLYSADIDDYIPRGDIRYVWLFGAIACFILALACINFINLSTARSANRAREVGLRKVVGSMRSLLVRQFLTESVMFSLLSFVIALFITALGLPYFNALSGKTISLPWGEWWFFPILGLAALVIGVIAGVYPSFYLSSFKPIDVLKGTVSRGARNSVLRSAMVVFQFTTSIVLIIGTFIIYRQMNFILTAKVGYEKDQVLMLEGTNTIGEQQESFKDELLRLTGIQAVTASEYFPVEGTKRDQNMFWREGKAQAEKWIGAQRWSVDDDYIQTLGMKLIAGRNFSEEIASDSQAVIINQAMARAFGFTKPLGERIVNWQPWTVIGVVEDFHFENMKGEVGPLCLTRGSGGNIIAIKVSSDRMADMLDAVGGVWKRFMPHQPMRYKFLDESYAKMYDDVQRMGKVFASFAILAIIVACLGLFALSAFMVEQRNKEISIRLVLGASLKSIFGLLTGNFIKLVLISFVVAIPVAWYMMDKWLQDYKYKTEITWDVFVIAGMAALLIALLTVSYQSVSAALANPVKSLRTE
jgi:putative ABC transport system permease protein